MITKLIKIGNSKGVRIPKSIIQQSGIANDVELEVKDDKIIIKPLKDVRKNWSDAFKEMAINNDDSLIDNDVLTNQSSWDDKEWTW